MIQKYLHLRTFKNPTDGIFTNSFYDDEGAVADFTNLEPIVNVSPIPTSRINSIHPSTLILGDPQLAVQIRSKVTKSSGAHAFIGIKSQDSVIVINSDESGVPHSEISSPYEDTTDIRRRMTMRTLRGSYRDYPADGGDDGNDEMDIEEDRML
ncbi:hypothetical protein Tco_0691077 [Tanacetum coccineum]